MTDRRIWTRSSYCGEGDACVYVATTPDGAVRVAGCADPGGGQVVAVSATAWAAFVRAVKSPGRGQV